MDCNDCKHLIITERKQNEFKAEGLGLMPHICMKYDKRVFHRTQSRFHSSYLYPCEECQKENGLSEWISIEDKLPEANARVLAVNSDGDVFLATYVEHKISPSARGYMTWASNMYNSTPIYWMPLPQLPTEKEN